MYHGDHPVGDAVTLPPGIARPDIRKPSGSKPVVFIAERRPVAAAALSEVRCATYRALGRRQLQHSR